MAVKTVAILSPGEMGAAVGEVLRESGLEVITCLEGRGEQTRRRAGECGFGIVSDLEEMAGRADLVLSILVPAEAASVARSVARAIKASDARPTYADCNAVSPQTASSLEPLIIEAGGTFADAGIIGGPPRDGYAPRFYASGPGASTLAELDGRGIDVVHVGGGSGRASAIKMCYAAMTKGATALQTALLVAALRLGVYEELRDEFLTSQRPAFNRIEESVKRLPSVAYRWIGEMEEIAATFESVDVTPDFHRGAADVFRLVAGSGLGKQDGPEASGIYDAIKLLADAVDTADSTNVA